MSRTHIALVCALFTMIALIVSVSARAKEEPTSKATQAVIPSGYEVYQNEVLEPSECGMAGVLQILQDRRVIQQYRDSWGNTNDPQMALAEDGEQGEGRAFLDAIAHRPLRNGRLRLIDAGGKVLNDEEFEVPLAKIDKVHLYGSKFPTYQVSADYGVGFGSYAGPITKFAEVRNGRLKYVEAIGPDRQASVISLMESLKTAWAVVPARMGGGMEIREIASRPDPTKKQGDGFVVEYVTYRNGPQGWRRFAHEEQGLWENGDDDS